VPAGKFTYDPSTDRFEDPGQPGLGAMDLRAVTEGQFYNVGRNVYYQPDPDLPSKLVGRLAFLAGSELTITRAGVILLENNIRTRELNQETLSNALYSGSVTGTFRLPGRDPIEVASEYVNLAPIGEQLWVPMQGARSKGDYVTPAPGEQPPPGFRLATPQETFQRGAVGFLLRNMRDVIAEIAAEGLQLGDGSVTYDDYEVAQYIAANLELSATITYDLSARVGL
jgi:hypothetical protein